jgi:predicted O-methyltransferase YrrM
MHVAPRIQQVLDRLEETRGLYYNVARPTASLLFFLVRLLQPKEILEVGTSNGYSALVLGAAVQPYGGRVTTIERSGRLIEEARRNILGAGLQDVVTVHPGSAYKILQRVPGPIEFAFLDATKQEYSGYLERIRPKLAPRALLAADNLLSHADELREFTHTVLSDDELTSTIVPVGLGLLLATREGSVESMEKHHVVSMGDLVAHAAQRVFHGTVAEVRSGEVFKAAAKMPVDPTLEGYDTALAEEALRLPGEE